MVSSAKKIQKIASDWQIFLAIVFLYPTTDLASRIWLLKVLVSSSIIYFDFCFKLWPDTVYVGGSLCIDLSGFDMLSYVINWAETITVICSRLMKHCLIPADLTWFPEHCSLLFPPFLLLFQQSRMEPSSSLYPLLPFLIPYCAAAAIHMNLTCDSTLDNQLNCLESIFHYVILI